MIMNSSAWSMERSSESAALPKRDFQTEEDMNCRIDIMRVSRLDYFGCGGWWWCGLVGRNIYGCIYFVRV